MFRSLEGATPTNVQFVLTKNKRTLSRRHAASGSSVKNARVSTWKGKGAGRGDGGGHCNSGSDRESEANRDSDRDRDRARDRYRFDRNQTRKANAHQHDTTYTPNAGRHLRCAAQIREVGGVTFGSAWQHHSRT